MGNTKIRSQPSPGEHPGRVVPDLRLNRPRFRPRLRTHDVSGFTMIELLVVVAIIGIVMTMAIPSIYRQLHPDSMRKAVEDVMEACRQARAQAILRRSPMEVRIRPYDRTIKIGPAQAPSRATSGIESLNVAGEEWRMAERGGSSGGASSRAESHFSARISDRISIEGIRLFIDDDFTEEELAVVRFYPNGMSDEFSIILRSDDAELRMINLDVITGLPILKTDPDTFMDYR